MRIVRPTLAVVMALVVLVLVGCDTTQPDRDQTRLASLTFAAQAIVDIYNCYEVWLDTSDPPDGTPDERVAEYCEPAVPPDGAEVFRAQRPVPWRYSLSVSVIRAGSTTEEIVGSSIQPQDLIDDFVSMTDYDPTQDQAPARPPAGTIYYQSPLQVSVGHPAFFASVGAPVRTPNILGQETPSFDFEVNSGDTVIVRARKQAVSELPSGINPDQITEVQLDAKLFVEGVQVATNGMKPPSSTADKAGFSFSFTLQ